MDIAAVVGTRPEIIKMSPILREGVRRGVRIGLIHAGQHRDRAMSGAVFRDLGLRAPDARVRPRSSRLVDLQAGVEPILRAMRPRLVLVQGDTNSALAGALAAIRSGARVAHVEAGLRSFDDRMVEEHNRRRIDALSSELFCPTQLQAAFLRRESLTADARVHVVGNTIADAVRGALPRLPKLEVGEPFALVTLHRAENVDDARTFAGLMTSVAAVALDCPIVWPMHPRIADRIPPIAGVRTRPPMGYLRFLATLRSASLVLTDSGGVQEEAAILNTPCVTLRPSTERQETVDRGSNRVAGLGRQQIVQAARAMWGRRLLPHPYGDGRTAARVLDVVFGCGLSSQHGGLAS